VASVAKVYIATAAVIALATKNCGIKSDTVAFGEAIYISTDVSNGAGSFVTHYQRRDAPSRRAVITMNIATTDSACRHAHQYFVASGRWNGNVGDFELAVLRKEKSFHLGPSKTRPDFAAAVRLKARR
jgi:hypothetical protein